MFSYIITAPIQLQERKSIQNVYYDFNAAVRSFMENLGKLKYDISYFDDAYVAAKDVFHEAKRLNVVYGNQRICTVSPDIPSMPLPDRRFPSKNLRLNWSHPLFEHVMEAASIAAKINLDLYLAIFMVIGLDEDRTQKLTKVACRIFECLHLFAAKMKGFASRYHLPTETSQCIDALYGIVLNNFKACSLQQNRFIIEAMYNDSVSCVNKIFQAVYQCGMEWRQVVLDVCYEFENLTINDASSNADGTYKCQQL